MAVELLSSDWARFAEKLRQNGYAILLRILSCW
jgi:hypothetical protein